MSADLAGSLAIVIRPRIAQKEAGLVFVERRSEARLLADALGATIGCRVEWITAERSIAERAALAAEMRDGTLLLAVCTAAWSTGVDVPPLRYILLCGRAKAPIGLLQSAGRGFRRSDGKAACEVLNVIDASDPRLARAARIRGETLLAAGLQPATDAVPESRDSEEAFLDELLEGERRSSADEAAVDSTPHWLWCLFGPPLLWQLVGLVIAIRLVLHYTGALPVEN